MSDSDEAVIPALLFPIKSVSLKAKKLQTKPQVKNMTNNYFDLFYTVIKNRDEKEIVDNEYEHDFINFTDFITPNYYIGIKNDDEILR